MGRGRRKATWGGGGGGTNGADASDGDVDDLGAVAVHGLGDIELRVLEGVALAIEERDLSLVGCMQALHAGCMVVLKTPASLSPWTSSRRPPGRRCPPASAAQSGQEPRWHSSKVARRQGGKGSRGEGARVPGRAGAKVPRCNRRSGGPGATHVVSRELLDDPVPVLGLPRADTGHVSTVHGGGQLTTVHGVASPSSVSTRRGPSGRIVPAAATSSAAMHFACASMVPTLQRRHHFVPLGSGPYAAPACSRQALRSRARGKRHNRSCQGCMPLAGGVICREWQSCPRPRPRGAPARRARVCRSCCARGGS
jgi:hypothetical protein